MTGRLAIVLSHPVQYYAPWFRYLAATGACEFNVFYLSDHGVAVCRDAQFGNEFAWDSALLSGYPHEFVPNYARHPDVTRFTGLLNPGLPGLLRSFAPTAVLLFGYAYRTHLRLIMRPPAPLVFRGDSHLLGQSRPNWRKRWILRWLYQRFAALTYVGQANRDYFRAFGVPDRKLFFAPHAVDATLYKATDQIRTQAKHLRTELRLGDRMVILFAGKFIPAKQPRELLEAFVALAPDNTALVFSGDGAEKSALVDLAAKNPSCFVRFLPFANQSEMPARYAMADLFVLPSRGFYETWGLAVNEAMHMGIPCLVSDRVGCQRDLVTDGETGWVFPVDDPQGLRRCLTRALAELTRHPKAMSGAIARRIAEYSYARATRGLVETLQSIPR